jgi:hypothetical protein
MVLVYRVADLSVDLRTVCSAQSAGTVLELDLVLAFATIRYACGLCVQADVSVMAELQFVSPGCRDIYVDGKLLGVLRVYWKTPGTTQRYLNKTFRHNRKNYEVVLVDGSEMYSRKAYLVLSWLRERGIEVRLSEGPDDEE